MRHLPRAQWSVVIRDHHRGFIDWETFEANQRRLAQNTHPHPHQAGGAVREGAALLQGIAKCGRCGRGLRVYYRGRNSAPGYYCAGHTIIDVRRSNRSVILHAKRPLSGVSEATDFYYLRTAQ
jgi:hypothetical protein